MDSLGTFRPANRASLTLTVVQTPSDLDGPIHSFWLSFSKSDIVDCSQIWGTHVFINRPTCLWWRWRHPNHWCPEKAAAGNNTPDAAPNMQSGDQGGGQPQGQDGMGQALAVKVKVKSRWRWTNGRYLVAMETHPTTTKHWCCSASWRWWKHWDPNIPPDTINQTVGKDGKTPPQPMEMGNEVVSKNQRKEYPFVLTPRVGWSLSIKMPTATALCARWDD